MATIVLTAVGGIFGPVGAAVGGLIGNAIDHGVLFKPKGRQGPRLADLQVQTSRYGSQIPQLFGTMRVAGTVIWATDLRETKSKSGGGKGQPSVTSYSYSASFAVALSARTVGQVKRIWADGNLLRGAAGDFKSELGAFRLHDGSEDQAVDPLIAAAQGVMLTPAHRGMAYAVFEDLALGDYGNRIPSLTFEVEADAEPVSIGRIATGASRGLLGGAAAAFLDGFAAEGADLGEALTPLGDAYGLAYMDAEDRLSLDDDPVLSGSAIGPDMLCARVDGRAVEAKSRAAEAAEAVPVALSVRHHDPARDYQAGVQRAVRPGPGRLESGIELPAAIDGDTARRQAAHMLARRWAGRSAMTLRGGWPLLVHKPGALVTVEGEPGLWRIEEREWEAMAVRLALRRVPGAGGTIPAGASSGSIVQQGDAPHGVTHLMLADLPALRDGVASAPVIVAAASGGAGWRKAALFVINEGGEAVPAGRTAPRATMGTTDTALPAGSATMVDEVNALSVTLLAQDMALLSADEAGLALGSNLCLAGRELIQFGRAVRTGPASFRLEALHRGLRGTEWAMSGHVPGEPFLLIEEDRLAEPLAVVGFGADIGALARVSAIGMGDDIPAEAILTIRGEAMVPPSPVHMTVETAGSGLVIGWVRRSRAGWRWSSGGEVPLAEEVERYAVRVMDGDVPVRSVEVGTPSWTYAAGAIADDRAAGHEGTVTIEVRQIGSRAAGRAATIAITI